MDGCGSNNMSISEDLSLFCESSTDPPDPSDGDRGQLSVNDLGKCLSDSLNIQNDQKSICGFIPSPDTNVTISLVKEDESHDGSGTQVGNPVTKKHFDKCATFPCSSKVVSSIGFNVDNQREHEQTSEVSPNGDANSANQPCVRSVSLPTPLKLVSAMKGSREKLGNPPKKLTVTWAPDVYDPPPTAVSHVPSNKPHRHRSDGKKNGKNKQKGGGKSTRGSKGKDKKQARKRGGSSSNCYKSLGDDNIEVSSSEPLASIVDLDVGSPDAFCGSSFLKKSVTKLHFSVAEAT